MDPTCVVPSLTVAAAAATNALAHDRHIDSLSLLTEAGRQIPSPADVPYPD
jgi:hypothetical protein